MQNKMWSSWYYDNFKMFFWSCPIQLSLSHTTVVHCNNKVCVGVGQIDAEGSGSLPETAFAVSGSEPDPKGSIPTPIQNKLIIRLLLFYAMTLQVNLTLCKQ